MNDHNAGRLKFGPDSKLYYTLGEQGANQFGNNCNAIRAQVLPTQEEVEAENWSSYSGKIIRMNPDGSIPEDNPTIDGVKSHIFSYRHRNPQGIVFGPDGILYQAEQGPASDDEVNIVEAGMNYGWPHVAGYRDDNAYRYANWSAAANCEQLEYTDVDIPEEVPQQSETEWSHMDFVEPVKSLYTVPDTYNFQDPTCDGMYFICWPTIAPASIDYYPADGAITGWSNSLFLTSLKNGALYVLPLTEDHRSVQGDVDQVFGTVNRYRDLAISPDTTEIFVATDSGGIARNIGGGVSQELENPGSILRFTYNGEGKAAPSDGAASVTPD